MANSPTDLGEKFVKSGMTLITQPASDYWLKKSAKMKEAQEFLRHAEWDDGFASFHPCAAPVLSPAPRARAAVPLRGTQRARAIA